jgi:hypothetical protein
LSGNTDAPGSSRARFLSRIPEGVRHGAVVLAVFAALGAAAWFTHEELRYLEPAEIERAPFPNRRIDVPSLAEHKGVTYFGKVKLRIYIPKSGVVDHVEVVSTTLPRNITEDTAKRFAAVDWEPGTRAGRKRRSVYIIEVNFAPPVEGLKSITPEN